MKWISMIWATVAAQAYTGWAVAQSVPHLVPYSGVVSVNGAPPAHIDELRVSLFASSNGGDLVWGPQIQRDVPVHGGQFSIVLGDQAALPLGEPVLRAPELWVQAEVNGTTLSPRQRVLAVPYARVTDGLADRVSRLESVTGWTVDADEIGRVPLVYFEYFPGPVGQWSSALIPTMSLRLRPFSASATLLCEQLPNANGLCGQGNGRVGLAFTPPAEANSVEACVTFVPQYQRFNGGPTRLRFSLQEVDPGTGNIVAAPRKVSFVSTPTGFGDGSPMTVCDRFTARRSSMGVELRTQPDAAGGWGNNGGFYFYPNESQGGFRWTVRAAP